MTGGADRVVTAALVVIPGPGETVTFVRQERGPCAGFWLLPGGKAGPGERIIDAARREAGEESGWCPRRADADGAYEILGPDHHFIMWAYRSSTIATAPHDFTGYCITAVRQLRWNAVQPHSTGMPILNGAGQLPAGERRSRTRWSASRS